MKITDVKKRKNTAIISLDDGSSFKLNLGFSEVISDDIYNLSDNQIKDLKEKSELNAVKNSALRMLARRSHSVKELHIKLKAKNYNSNYINEVLKELSELGYLNDYDFANEFIKSKIRSKRDGIAKIKSQLFAKGVSREIIDEVVNVNIEESKEDILKNVKILAEKKIKLLTSQTSKQLSQNTIKEKVTIYLKNKGYSFDEIKTALEKLI